MGAPRRDHPGQGRAGLRAAERRVPALLVADGDEPPTDTVAGAPLDTDSASSIPIPLLILAGLALLLVAGGSAGYVIRRIQARRVPPRTT